MRIKFVTGRGTATYFIRTIRNTNSKTPFCFFSAATVSQTKKFSNKYNKYSHGTCNQQIYNHNRTFTHGAVNKLNFAEPCGKKKLGKNTTHVQLKKNFTVAAWKTEHNENTREKTHRHLNG